MKKILVTGAGGNIGSHFVRAYGDSYDFRLNDFDEPENKDELGRDWVIGDLSDMQLAKQAVQGVDTVIHLAANPSGSAIFEELLPNNIIATYNVFQASKEAGVRRIIFASTIQTIYGYPDDLAVTPDMPPRPTNLYGASKAWGEALCSVYSKQGIQCAAIRIGAFMEPEKLPQVAKPGTMKEYVSADDLTKLIMLILESSDFEMEVYNGLSDNYEKRLDISKEREQLSYEPTEAALPPEVVKATKE